VPQVVALVSCDQQTLTTGTLRADAWYSGISAAIDQHGGLRSSSNLVSDLDRRTVNTTGRRLATAPPASPIPESLTRSN
jgi:hypothetical protein